MQFEQPLRETNTFRNFGEEGSVVFIPLHCQAYKHWITPYLNIDVIYFC